MVCLFCNQNSHESKNCDKYKSEEDRKSHPISNKFCFSCFVESDAAHYSNGNEKCGKKNCCGWYSHVHHKLYCKERIKVLTTYLFLPKIDQDLLPRFLKTIEEDEKYLMLVTSPIAPKMLFNFKRIKVMDSFEEDLIIKCRKSDLVVIIEDLTLCESNEAPRKKLYNFIKAKTVILPPKIDLLDSSLSAGMILQLLSSSTTDFQLDLCPSNLKFSDIIKKAPNLDNIRIRDFETNIIYDDFWIKDLLKSRNDKKYFKSLVIKLDKVDFDVEDMVEFINKKCCKTAYLNICFTQDLIDDDSDGVLISRIQRKINEYFDCQSEGDEGYGTLTVGYDGVDGYETYTFARIKEPIKIAISPERNIKIKESENPNVLRPKRVMPIRAATKRKYI